MMGEGAYRKFMKIREKHGCKTGRKSAYWERTTGNQDSCAGYSYPTRFITCLSRKAFISGKSDVYLLAETGSFENTGPACFRLHKPVKVCDWRGEAFVIHEKEWRDGIC